MGDQRAFDFRGAEPAAIHFESIVGAARVPEISVGILMIFVAGAEPGTVECGVSFFGLIPIAGANGIALDQQISNFAGSDFLAVLVDDFCFIAGNELAAGARARFARTISDDHLQGFGGAEGIENFHAESLFEAFEERSGERFTGGDGVADTGKIEFAAVLAAMGEECSVI